MGAFRFVTLAMMCGLLHTSNAYWIPTHKYHQGPPTRPAAPACKHVVHKLGTYIPSEWRCHCKTTNDTNNGYHIANNDVLLLPHLNTEFCTVPETSYSCDSNLYLGPGPALACKMAGLDIAMAIEPKTQSPWGEDLYDDEVAANIIQVWRNYTCQRTPEHQACSNSTAKLPGVVLDYGAEQTGRQLRLLSDLFPMSSLFGYNVRAEGRLLETDFMYPGPFTLIWGDGANCLPFPDNTFDFVYSINVMEHANPVEKYIAEALRVLKPDGLLYLNWQPLWFSAKGHHVHDDMVRELAKMYAREHTLEECLQVEYANDGKTIPDWSHLWQTEAEFNNTLYNTKLKHCPPLVAYLVDMVYHSPGLNRASLSQVLQFLEVTQVAEVIKTKFQTQVEGLYDIIAEEMAMKYGHVDVAVGGAQLWVRRLPGSVGPVHAASMRKAARRKAIDDTHEGGS